MITQKYIIHLHNTLWSSGGVEYLNSPHFSQSWYIKSKSTFGYFRKRDIRIIRRVSCCCGGEVGVSSVYTLRWELPSVPRPQSYNQPPETGLPAAYSQLSLSLSVFVATWLSNNLGMSVKQSAASVAPWPAFTSLCKVALVRTLKDTHEFKLEIWLHYKPS